MRVVLDTNVLVSALINPYGTPASVLSLVLDARITVCYDSRIFIEYSEVLNRSKFGFDKSEIRAVQDMVRENGFSVVAVKTEQRSSDPYDLPFLEVAAAAQADFLITGNSSHFPSKIGKTKVVTPAAFINAFFSKK